MVPPSDNVDEEEALDARVEAVESDEGDLIVTDLNKKVVMEPKDITIF